MVSKTASCVLGPGVGKDAHPMLCWALWPHSYLQGSGVLEGTVASVEQFLLWFCLVFGCFIFVSLSRSVKSFQW